MVDRGLLVRVKQIYGEKARGDVTIADVLAVIMKESSGVPTFTGKEALYRANLRAADGWRENGTWRSTDTTEQEIAQAFIIPDGPLKGLRAKFRFERSYWYKWALPLAQEHKSLFTPTDLVVLSSSVGLGQQMIRYVVEHHKPQDMLAAARRFMGDVAEQIRWVIGNLQRIHNEDKQLMFARYNLGSAKINGFTYWHYGKDVLASSEKIEEWLKEHDK
jgi:hypothetical protein